MRTFDLTDAERLEHLRDADRRYRAAREALNELELALSGAEARHVAGVESQLARAHTSISSLLADAELRAIAEAQRGSDG